MAQLAIQGHATRGREVIELLEMLGGIDIYEITTAKADFAYTIRSHDNVIIGVLPTITFIILSLEEFLEKFPYKVGDKVIIKSKNKKAIISKVTWYSDTITYWLRYDGFCENNWRTEDLEPYKGETMEKKEEISLANIYRYIRLIGYDFYDDKGNIIDAKEIILKKKQPQCPKTYEECCRIVNANPCIRLTYDLSDGQKYYYDADNLQVYESIRKLLVCRDAYWNIAGVEMGLGEPWEPDWEKVDEKKYCIVNIEGNIAKWVQKTINKILAFPTEEMRDDFYENFKGEIEQCKELL